MEFVRLFFTRLDFNEHDLAYRFWPLGREKSIVIDPAPKLGHPIIIDSNIYPETFYPHIIAGDPVPYIAPVYGLSEKQVIHA